MKTDLVAMSTKELERLALMRRIAERRTTQREVAAQLGLSLRQVERLYARYKAGGAPGLVSKRRGTVSSRRLPAELRTRALGIVRTQYADFGPTLAHRRSWSRSTGSGFPLRRRRHEPTAGTALRTGVDVRLLRVDPPLPRAARQARRIHSDKLSVFRVNAKDPKAGDGYTQFGRALSELNIDIICAKTPAAKGRVERANLTLQDRLVKELRLRGISTVEAGNAFLPEFREDYNRRFAREPQSAHDAHRPQLPHESLDQTFALQEQRKVTSNLTLHYNRVMYLLEPRELAERTRGKHVQVRE